MERFHSSETIKKPPSRVEVLHVHKYRLELSPALQQLLSGQLCWYLSVVNILMSILSARKNDNLKTTIMELVLDPHNN